MDIPSILTISQYGTLPIGGTILTFSVIFYLTSLQERCWYRRYMLPLMTALIALFVPTIVEKIILVVAAFLMFFGYRGRGRAAMALNKE